MGLGAIGKQLALRLGGFDCQVLAYDPFPDENFAGMHKVKLVPMDAVVANADFLSLHLPLLPETRGLVDRSFLSRMKRGAYLINTARGEVVDETALTEALLEGHLRGAALDALIQEPPGPDHPLLNLPPGLPRMSSSPATSGRKPMAPPTRWVGWP